MIFDIKSTQNIVKLNLDNIDHKISDILAKKLRKDNIYKI